MYLKKTALLGGLLLALVAISPLSLMADDDSEVKHRQMLMTISNMHLRSLGLILNGKIPHEEHLFAHAEGMQVASQILPHIYPEGSMTEDSAASANIWKDHETFLRMVEKSDDATSNLLAAIKSYNRTSSGLFPEKKAQRRQLIVEAYRDVKESCRNCHRIFRE